MRGEIHTCNNGEPCVKCHEEGVHATCYNEPCEDAETVAHTDAAASRKREASIARRVVLAQNGIIEAALDLATRPPRL